MSPQPLPIRIADALRLSPMTVADLARCLSVSPATVRHRLPDANVRRSGTQRGKTHPWNRWEVAA
jgi:hypothetical protein